jgi:hypothetical protein
MGDFFKIQCANRGKGCPNRSRKSAVGLTAWPAGRPRRGFAPVPGGFSCRPQSRQAQQVVSRRHKVAPGLCPFQAPIPAPPKSTHRLDPPKDFLHPLADFQTQLVTLLTCGAPIQSSHRYFLFARHRWRDRPFPAALHKAFLVIALVGAEGFDLHALMQFLVGVHLRPRHGRFAVRYGIVQGEASAQAVPVFHQRVRPKTQPRFLPAGFPIQHAVRVGAALVRVVAPGFPAKVDRRIARVFVLGRLHFRRVAPVLAHKAFQARPRFDQRAVGGEVFVAGPALLPAQVIHFDKEEFGHVRREHAVIVLGKDAVVEAAFAELPVQEPKPQEIVAELFAEQAFAAHAVERRQHPRLEQLLRRNRGRTVPGIKLVKQRRKLLQHGIHAALDGTQRMLGGHALVEVDDRQKVRLGLRFSAHGFQTNFNFAGSNVFQQTVKNPLAQAVPKGNPKPS